MEYRKMLDEAINKSGLTLKEIVALCKHHGVKIDHSSLSNMRNGVQPPSPDEEKNRILAMVLRTQETMGISEEQFVLTAGIEHTPTPVVKNVVGTLGIVTLEAAKVARRASYQAEVIIKAQISGAPYSPEVSAKFLEDIRAEQQTLSDASDVVFWFMEQYREALHARTGESPGIYSTEEEKVSTRDSLIESLARVTGVPNRILMTVITGLEEAHQSGISRRNAQMLSKTVNRRDADSEGGKQDAEE